MNKSISIKCALLLCGVSLFLNGTERQHFSPMHDFVKASVEEQKSIADVQWQMKSNHRSAFMHQLIETSPEFVLNHVKFYITGSREDDVEGAKIAVCLLIRLVDRKVDGAKEYAISLLKSGTRIMNEFNEKPIAYLSGEYPKFLVGTFRHIAEMLNSIGDQDILLSVIPNQFSAVRSLYIKDGDGLLSSKELELRKSMNPLMYDANHPLRNELISYNEFLRKLYVEYTNKQPWE